MNDKDKRDLLNKAVRHAADLEDADKHLTTQERETLVACYLELNPTEILPADLTEAYLEIIF